MSELRDELAQFISLQIGAHLIVGKAVADALLTRYAVVELPPVHPEEFTRPTHAKVPSGDDPTWSEVSLRTDGRIQLASINNPFRTDAEARDTAAAILAILAAKDAK